MNTVRHASSILIMMFLLVLIGLIWAVETPSPVYAGFTPTSEPAPPPQPQPQPQQENNNDDDDDDDSSIVPIVTIPPEELKQIFPTATPASPPRRISCRKRDILQLPIGSLGLG